jgi:hypothetical protein
MPISPTPREPEGGEFCSRDVEAVTSMLWMSASVYDPRLVLHDQPT